MGIRLLRPSASLCCAALFGVSAGFSAEGIREVPLRLDGLTFDRAGRHLYGAASNQLMQIDAETGEVLRTFNLVDPIREIEMGAGRSLWVGQDFKVRRFDLGTFAADEPVSYPGAFLDVAPSLTNPNVAAISTPTINGRYATAWIIRDGLLLPDSQQFEKIALNGSFIFGDVPGSAWHRATLGPNGIIAGTYSPIAGAAFGEYKSLGRYVYNASGQGVDAQAAGFPNISATWQFGYTYAPPTQLAVNPENNSVYFLTRGDSLVLNRHEHPTLRPTGHYRFPNAFPDVDLSVADLVAWSTNRAAFNGRTNLYLLDTGVLFAPGDLEVVQRVDPNPAIFGGATTMSVIVTNRGPGAVLNVQIASSLSNAVSLRFLEPGATYQAQFRYAPTNLNAVTFSSSITAENEINTQNNAATTTVQVVAPPGRVAHIAIPVNDVTFDPLTRTVFYVARPELIIGRLDPAALTLSTSYGPGERIEVGNTNGILFSYHRVFGSSLDRMDTVTGARARWSGTLGIGMLDLAPSPAGDDLIALSDSSGTYVARNKMALGGRLAAQGEVEFSPDGKKLYFLNSGTCQVEIYNVVESGLSADRVITDAGCSSFTQLGGLLYFNNGTIYDPVANRKLPNSLALTVPSFVVPRTNEVIDVLTRTNGGWVVRRFAGADRQLRLTVPVPQLTETPVEVINAGENHVLISTGPSGSGMYLVNLSDLADLRLSLSRRNFREVLLSFPSVAGTRYRLERKASLSDPAWQLARELQGTGEQVDEPVSVTGNTGFFRVTRI